MSIIKHAGNRERPRVVSEETMLEAIEELGIVPFFENPIAGYSIEELTPREYWFDGGDSLGPWDWKIYSVQSGEIAYGKFLWGGKAAFATVRLYRELMNWRRSLPKYTPTAQQKAVLDLLEEQESIGIRDVRTLLGIKKSAADAIITKLQMQTRVVTGDITRVYRGEDLHYNGWQVSSFCTPEALFADDTGLQGFPGFPSSGDSLQSSLTPEQSREFLMDHIRSRVPGASEAQILRMFA